MTNGQPFTAVGQSHSPKLNNVARQEIDYPSISAGRVLIN
jgi:hypothetical protein